MRQSRELIGIGQRAMRNGRAKAQVIELVVARAQADFNVGQAVSVSQLREGHGKELIPTGEVTNAVVTLVAIDASAKLLGVNPLHDLRENRLCGAHFRILALSVLWKSAKQSRNRSHLRRRASRSFSNSFISQQFD